MAKAKAVVDAAKKQNGKTSRRTTSKKSQDTMEGSTSLKTCTNQPRIFTRIHNRNGRESILHFIYKCSLGQSFHSQMRQCLQQPFLRSLATYKLHRTTSLFNRRITCIEWHPTHTTSLAIGSKGGDIVLWDYNRANKMSFIQGKGAGDFIGGIKFCPTDLSKIYTVSGDGSLAVQSFEGHQATTLSTTPDCGHGHHSLCFWYCCVDVSVSRQMLVTGDNMGNVQLLGIDGHKIFSEKLHKAKVTHAEFNPRCDWLLATASVDHTVKLWDLRNIKDKSSFFHNMPHDKAVNSAYFNPLDCSKLLTTDQYDQIRVYSSADWSSPQHIIQHPHRQFQHLTPIKATWHPMYDLIVAGRYPDDNVCTGDTRTIDIYDANSAQLVCQLHDASAPGIISVNKFNPMGDVLGSGMGVNILMWTSNNMLGREQEDPQEQAGGDGGRFRGQPRTRLQRFSRERRGVAEDAKLKKKLASLESPGAKTKSKPLENGKTQKGKKK
ncbi:DNA damage-binding protein 2 [Osmerus eperlanus]|uniref:DNA damage-binding protein 2 n=1 Tax=Osmerus eperlanus TaxID=29151 RepID=UPI002E0E0654